MKKFDIPDFYKSSIIAQIKSIRKDSDKLKNEFSPTLLDFGPIQFYTARHFGFCYGVENAIEIIYTTIKDNVGKRIYLLSEMIHNPKVNADLQDLGLKFIMDTFGNQLIPWEDISSDDIVVIPAFGTSIEIENKLKAIGIEIKKYDTTCPFVSKVWKRTAKLGQDNYSIVVHGKPKHEETRATFSHSKKSAPTLVIKNIEEAQVLADIILDRTPKDQFYSTFEGRYSEGFSVEKDLVRIGVVNQTTMLANETQEIADFIKDTMAAKYGEDKIKEHFPDNRDTLCYATNDNQRATYGLLEQEADIAIVVGGYNSSNTSHLVELCEHKLPTFFISGPDEIVSEHEINHFDFMNQKHLTTQDWLPPKLVDVKILVTSGASCPDATVDHVLKKVMSFYNGVKDIDEVLHAVKQNYKV